jgi:transcription termination/antitermination protein NusG
MPDRGIIRPSTSAPDPSALRRVGTILAYRNYSFRSRGTRPDPLGGGRFEPKGAEPMTTTSTSTPIASDAVPAPQRPPAWRALWTRSHCERLVCDQLAGQGFHPFLPRVPEWRTSSAGRHRVLAPMFPGYLFLRDALDKPAYLQVIRARGLVAVLGQGWDRLAEVPEDEMAAIERLERLDLPLRPHPFLAAGRRVRIERGPLAGLEGVLLRHQPRRHLLVVSVALLRRSVAVEVDCDDVGEA